MTILNPVALSVAFFAEPVLVERYRDGYVVNAEGMKVAAPLEPCPIRASVHPAPAELLDRLPEGQRTRRTIVVYTESRLFTADQDSGRRADLIVYDLLGDENPVRFEVEDVRRWRWGTYYEVLAQEVRKRV